MPAGLSSTLIHFVPLLTTTSPCGQYFFVRSFLLSNKSRSKKKFGCRPAVARLWRSRRSGTLQHRIDYPRHVASWRDTLRRVPNVRGGHTNDFQSALAFFRFPFNFPRRSALNHAPHRLRPRLCSRRRTTLCPRPAGQRRCSRQRCP